jgi:hypothetical protein
MMLFRDSGAPTRMDGIDALLKLGRYIGLMGFLGGLAALAAMWFLGRAPQNASEWNMLVELTRAVFLRCMFAGIVVLAVIGSLSWWRHRRRFHRARWFRIMMVALLIAIPSLHLWARFTMLKIRDAVETNNLDAAAELWSRMGTAYLISLIIILAIAAVGIIKPSLGQRR